MKSKPHKASATRDRLVETAAGLFARRGYDGVSVREIVAGAGANLGAVTYHFGGKEKLFSEVVVREVERVMAKGRSIVDSDRSPRDKLAGLLRVWAMHVLHEDPQSRILFAEILGPERHLPPQLIKAVSWRNEMFHRIVKAGVREGVFRECDVEHAAWCFFGMLSPYLLYGPLVGSATKKGRYPKAYVNRVVDAALDLALNGLCRPRTKGGHGGKK